MAIMNCTCKVSILLYHFETLPAGLENMFLKYCEMVSGS